MKEETPEEKIRRLEDTLEHLRKCKEFESSLQRDVINFGAKYVQVRRGSTYNVTDAWEAIKRELLLHETKGY